MKSCASPGRLTPLDRRHVPAPTLRHGAAGRRLAEEHYDVHKVNHGMLHFMGLV